MAANDDWKDEVREKLVGVFKNHAETLTRILFYLDEEERGYRGDQICIPPVWRTLKSTLCSDAAFRTYAKRLAEDTKMAEKDERFRHTMNLLYSEMMDHSDTNLPEDYAQGFDMVRVTELEVSEKSAFIGLARAWSLIPRDSQAQILEIIPKIVTNRQVATAVDDVVGLVNRTGGHVVVIALAAIHLGWEAIKNFKRWWDGEISGKRCCKNILDATFSIAAGAAGGFAGAAVGTMAGPVGCLVGGILGGFISSTAMNVISDRFTQLIFGIPKDEALENAYTYLGVSMTASNHEINTAFRQMCLLSHPDRPGGSKEDFLLLQLHMGCIKASRNELY